MSKIFDFILIVAGCVVYTGMGIIFLGYLLSNIGYFKKNKKILCIVLGIVALAYFYVAYHYGLVVASFALIGIPVFALLAIGMVCFAILEPVWFVLFVLASMVLGGYSSYYYEPTQRMFF